MQKHFLFDTMTKSAQRKGRVSIKLTSPLWEVHTYHHLPALFHRATRPIKGTEAALARNSFRLTPLCSLWKQMATRITW